MELATPNRTKRVDCVLQNLLAPLRTFSAPKSSTSSSNSKAFSHSVARTFAFPEAPFLGRP